MPLPAEIDASALATYIKGWAKDLGFQSVGIADTKLQLDEQHLQNWLAKNYHGSMEYMSRHGAKRSRPEELLPGTLRIISVRMDYLPQATAAEALVNRPTQAFIARYALGRDYHKVLRKRLQHLADRIGNQIGEFGYRVFVDSAPVLEKALGRNAGIGWIGKHTLLIDKSAGSYFFLGELYTDLPLPADNEVGDHCGSCQKCIDICPTRAIVAPYQLDARKCIAYLTIEHKGSIEPELRPLIGNRVFGCDDCQFVCPWNRFAQISKEIDFQPREGLDGPQLIDLFAWSEAEYLQRTEGGALRRIGYEGWLRNIAIALGNAPSNETVIHALQLRLNHESSLVREHVEWALQRHANQKAGLQE